MGYLQSTNSDIAIEQTFVLNCWNSVSVYEGVSHERLTQLRTKFIKKYKKLVISEDCHFCPRLYPTEESMYLSIHQTKLNCHCPPSFTIYCIIQTTIDLKRNESDTEYGCQLFQTSGFLIHATCSSLSSCFDGNHLNFTG